VTFDLDVVWLAWWFILTLSSSCIKVDVKVQVRRRKNVGKVVGVISSLGMLVHVKASQLLLMCIYTMMISRGAFIVLI